MSHRGALVFFVKTPGFSPIKTRLANEVGNAMAEEFYLRSLSVLRALAREIRGQRPRIDVWWAVAEDAALGSPHWLGLPTIGQGHGGLGNRLARVYGELLKVYDFVAMMGADSPHIAVTKIIEALAVSERCGQESFVVGPCSDGGFYYFSGGRNIENTVWESVGYSTENTLLDLCCALRDLAPMVFLEPDFDVDTQSDLLRLARLRAREGERELLAEQAELVDWATRLLG